MGLQQVVNVVRHLLDATTNGTGRKAHARKDRTLLKTSWGFAGRIAMLLPSRVAGRTLGLRGPDLARGPEVARPCSNARFLTNYPLGSAYTERRSSVVVSKSAYYAVGRGSLPRPGALLLLGVKTWICTLEIMYLCVFRMRH